MPRKQKQFHFIYKTTCVVNNKFYVGMHSTDNLDDGYLGSGKRLGYSIGKYGRENHIYEKLEFLPNREKLREREIELVSEELLNDPLCMNLAPGGGGGFINKEHAEKFYAAGGKKVFQLLNQRHIEKIKFDPDYKEKWIRSLINCDNPGFSGRKHSDKTKEKMRNHKGKQLGELNSQYGTCWITNGKENKKIRKGDSIPEGYKLGRKINLAS